MRIRSHFSEAKEIGVGVGWRGLGVDGSKKKGREASLLVAVLDYEWGGGGNKGEGWLDGDG